MADYLASIYGTEKDKVNCSFYYKTGACRHGDRCSRVHSKPAFSQTIVLQNMYCDPLISAQSADGTQCKLMKNMTKEEAQQHFENFYEDVFVEMEDKYGQVEEMNVCENLGDHLVGNVYVKFRREEDAAKAVEALNNRWFGGRTICAELSPVTNFREASCRQHEMGKCSKSDYCNFMHLKSISRELRRQLCGRPSRRSRSRSRPRSREDRRYRGRDRRRSSRGRDTRYRSRSREIRHRSRSRESSRSVRRRYSPRCREERYRSRSGQREDPSRSRESERGRDRPKKDRRI